MYRGEKPLLTKLAPEWALDKLAEHAVDFWLTTEDLPRPDNRVTLERDGTVRLSYTPNNDVPKICCTRSSSRCWGNSVCTPMSSSRERCT